METKKKLLLGFFILLSCVHVATRIAAINLIADLTKSLLIPALFILVWVETKPQNKYLIALFFSWLGDLFLIGEGTLFFVLGVAAFWCTQLLYIHLLLKEFEKDFWKRANRNKTIIPFLFFGSYLTVVLASILPQLGVLKPIVTLYAITLCVSGFLGVTLWNTIRDAQSTKLAIGIFLFVLSDSMIAFDAFYFEVPYFTYWIMLTYIPAQYLISRFLAFSLKNS